MLDTYQSRTTIRPKFIVMNLFNYDPKFLTLPLYDRFPLILPLDAAKFNSILEFSLLTTMPELLF